MPQILQTKGGKIKLFVSTINMGNEQPDLASLDAWIPKDGLTRNIIDNPRYPIKTCFDVDGMVDSESSMLTSEQQLKQPPSPSEKNRFDLIVLGMQEATFHAKKRSDALIGGVVKNVAKTIVDPAKKIISEIPNADTLIGPIKDHSNAVNGSEDLSKDERPSISEDASERMITKPASPERVDSLVHADDTKILHRLFEYQLPTYVQAGSYQRGQMRLLIFYNPNTIHNFDVMSVKAQNTGVKFGVKSLPNKGGIVAEVKINNTTRISFLTAHLEAHEGKSKYSMRCSTMGEIFKGTPSDTTIEYCKYDTSLTNHYTFVMGDLNFRTSLPNHEAGSKEHVQASHDLVKGHDYHSLNQYDELRMALEKKECLVGFSTPLCWFPPTFKVTKHQSGYVYNEKRSPSYTDRILFKACDDLSEKVKLLVYEPVEDFLSSDHKPLRGVFEIELIPTLRSKRRLARQATFFPKRKKLEEEQMEDRHENFQMYMSSIRCKIDRDVFAKMMEMNLEDYSPTTFVQFLSTPAKAIKANKTFFSSDESMSSGFPRTRKAKETFEPNWDQDLIHVKVRTHRKNGSPIDLTGSMLHVSVFDKKHKKEKPKLVGSVTLNLASIIVDSQQNLKVSTKKSGEKSGEPLGKIFDFSGYIKRLSRKSPAKRPDDKVSGGGESESVILNSDSAMLNSSGHLTKGPSTSLMSSPRRSSRKRWLPKTWTRSKASSKPVSTSTTTFNPEGLNIQSMDVNKSLVKDGKEIGRIEFTIDTCWLSDKEAASRINQFVSNIY